jgi:hypothetical protein
MTGGRRGKRTESGGGRLGEERAHGPRLSQKSLHGGQWRSFVKRLGVFVREYMRLLGQVRKGRGKMIRKRVRESRKSFHMLRSNAKWE